MTPEICALTSPSSTTSPTATIATAAMFPAPAALPARPAPLREAPGAAGPPAAEVLASPQPNAEQATPYARSNGVWRVVEEAVVGLAHRAKNLPCQDAAQAVCRPRPAVVVADGAGSSAVSELGARAVVTGTVRLLDSLDKPLAELLDSSAAPAPELVRTWGLTLVKHARGLLTDLAAEHRREVRDVRCTFLLMVAGRERLLWLKVGDGALVVEKMRQLPQAGSADAAPAWQAELTSLGEPGKGEFANQTVFLDGAAPDDVQLGCLPAGDITGMAAMSDGAAERLVSSDGRRVAPRIASLLEQLRQERLHRPALTQMFYEEGFCKGSSGDDRSLALAASGMLTPLGVRAHEEPCTAAAPAQAAPASAGGTAPVRELSSAALPPVAGTASAGMAAPPGRPTLRLQAAVGKGKKRRR